MASRAKLLDGDSDDIIRQNQKSLCDCGMNDAQAWSVALKRAKKAKAADRAKKGMMSKPRKNKVEVK
jgi:hypothetical protein